MAKLDNPWKAFTLVGAIGADMAATTIVGYYIGHTLDTHFGTDPLFLLIGVFAGLAAGFYGIYLLVKPFLGD